MFCVKCGNQLPNEAAFCTFCGTPTANANINNNNIELKKLKDKQKCINCVDSLPSDIEVLNEINKLSSYFENILLPDASVGTDSNTNVRVCSSDEVNKKIKKMFVTSLISGIILLVAALVILLLAVIKIRRKIAPYIIMAIYSALMGLFCIVIGMIRWRKFLKHSKCSNLVLISNGCLGQDITGVKREFKLDDIINVESKSFARAFHDVGYLNIYTSSGKYSFVACQLEVVYANFMSYLAERK